MPLGPRPEPPQIPRKEPRIEYDHQLAHQIPVVPPKVPIYQPIPTSSSITSISSISSTGSSSSSRLKGPRPISPSKNVPRKPLPPKVSLQSPRLPYPDADPVPVTPFNEFGETWRMPEPEFPSPVPSLAPPSVYTLQQSPQISPQQSTHRKTAGDIIPPSQYNTNRPTKSIFQWGIPNELLPPMPVPVDSMSGLKMGNEGHYTMNIDLPEIPPMEPVRPKFSVEQLTVNDFMSLGQIWSVSAIARWIYDLAMTYDAEISVTDTVLALAKLFLYRIPHLEWKLAEDISASAIESLKSQEFIDTASTQLVLRTVPVSGVITPLSGFEGCYSSSVMPYDTVCYSSRCIKEPRTSSLHRQGTFTRPAAATATAVFEHQRQQHEQDAAPIVPLENQLLDPFTTPEMNWRKFWHLEEADLGSIDPKLIKLQFAFHELIMSEVSYVRDLRIYLDVYGVIELMQGLSVMSDQHLFTSRVFEQIKAVLTTNEQLLSHLLAEQSRQGPYIHTIAEWITQWATHPATLSAYQQYSDGYLWADTHLRKELASSPRLQKWMEERAKDPRLTGRPHSFFFHRVLPRVARYQLLLHAVLKYMPDSAELERKQLEQAIAACTNLTQECDNRVAKQRTLLDVQNLKAHIVFKSSAVTADLKLGDKRRKLIRRGNLIRRGDMKMEWVDTHALLLDNFFVMSKTREGMNGTAFYITKPPIPLDLLVLESVDEDAVTKMSSRLTLTRHGGTNSEQDNQPNSTELGDKNTVLFPIRISHLGSGKSSYILFAPNKPERNLWSKAIVEAKQARAQLAFARSAEPFKLVRVSDQFAYPESETPQLPIPIPDTPLHRAVDQNSPSSVGRVILRRKVNCMVQAGTMYLAGTDHGIWLGQSSTGEWSRVSRTPQRVLKIEVLDTMNLLFVLCGDHNLVWYPLDQMIARGLGDTRKSLGVRLNQHRKVVDFATSYHRGRVVVMYLQNGGQLKVIEPIRSHGASVMKNLADCGLSTAASCVDSFREADRMLVSSDTAKVQPLLKSIVLTSAKSFDWVSLDTKRPARIPIGRNSKEMQYWGRPVRLVKLDGSNILLCYESCYVICDVSGNIGIQPTTWFLDKVADCAYYAPYLILFSQGRELIEIRYVDEFPGRLVQIITGKDIKLMSDNDDTVYIRMAHPWAPGRQLLLHLSGNEVIKDNTSTWYSSSSGN